MLRDLAHEMDITQGKVNVSEIARKTGYDRKTIRKYLAMEVPPEPQKRTTKKSSKLDDYKEYITQRLNDYPEITAVRTYREILDKGYSGKYTIVKDFVRQVRPKQRIQAVYRYETKPGVQAQVDWGECGSVETDGKTRKLYCFSMVLGYSRMRYVEFTLSIDVYTFIQCHLNAFRYFGGYPKEVLYDNMKQVVIKRLIKSSDSQWNTTFEDFTRHYGFIHRLCRPYRPQTKGKIESTIGYVKRDFFYGGSFNSLQDINSQAQKWLDRVNANVHGTTYEIPLERLKKEYLQPFDAMSVYRIVRKEQRKISRDCYISYQGNKYSVPYEFAKRSATIHIENSTMTVVIDGHAICEHEILPGNNRVVKKKEHFKGLLSEVLKENSSKMAKPRTILKFSGPIVEHRPISDYEEFS